MVKALDLRSNGRMSAWVQTPLLVNLNFYNLIISKLKYVVSNVPSKLCACARAHGPWSQRTKELSVRTQNFFSGKEILRLTVNQYFAVQNRKFKIIEF